MKTLMLSLVLITIAGSCSAQDIVNTAVDTFNGNTFQLQKKLVNDTFELWDPVTMIKNVMMRDSMFCPVNMNGRHIYYPDELRASSQTSDIRFPLEEQILNNYQRLYTSPVDDGELWIDLHRVVIDENGKVVYGIYNGIKLIGSDKTTRCLNSLPLEQVFENVTVTPSVWRGEKVLSERRLFLNKYHVELKDHHVVYNRI